MALAGPAIVVALCWIRSPDMLKVGRFWAEDTMFFGEAHARGTLLGKLGYVYKGHYELFATVSHAVASYAKLKLAPLVTGTADLGLECLLAFLIVILRRDLGMRLAPALAISALLVVSPCASEHYLNAVNSQRLASAILFVLIALPAERLARGGPAACAAAFLLGLTGLSSCVLLPVAVIYAVAHRSRPYAAVAAGLSAACLIQGALIASHPVESRFLPVDPSVYLLSPFLQVVVKHLMGVDAERYLASWLRGGPMATQAFTSFLLLPFGGVVWMARHILRGDLHDALLLLSIVIVTSCNEIGAIGDRNAMVGPLMMRYFFLPSLIAAFFLARSRPASQDPLLGRATLALALLVSTADFFGNDYNDMLVTLNHDWPRQVDACRAGPTAPCRVETSPDGFRIEIPGGRPPR